MKVKNLMYKLSQVNPELDIVLSTFTLDSGVNDEELAEVKIVDGWLYLIGEYLLDLIQDEEAEL